MPSRMPRRVTVAITLAFLAGAALGALATLPRSRADDHAAGDPKRPVTEVLHCPLAFAGVHLQKDRPENTQVACSLLQAAQRRRRPVRPLRWHRARGTDSSASST